jgi:hypothetical protein
MLCDEKVGCQAESPPTARRREHGTLQTKKTAGEESSSPQSWSQR